MDIVTLMIIGFGTAAGYKRGLILEITDWLIGGIAGLIAFRGFRPLAGFMHRLIKGWPVEYCERAGFWFLLLFFGIMILSLGLHIDRATREYDRIPPEVRNYGGAFSAFFKTLVICSLLCAYLPYSDGLAAAEKTALRRSTAATTLKALGPPVGVLVGIVTPEDIANKYRKAISSTAP
jgi:hypothetical protein